jgi:hypothetical protein
VWQVTVSQLQRARQFSFYDPYACFSVLPNFERIVLDYSALVTNTLPRCLLQLGLISRCSAASQGRNTGPGRDIKADDDEPNWSAKVKQESVAADAITIEPAISRQSEQSGDRRPMVVDPDAVDHFTLTAEHQAFCGSGSNKAISIPMAFPRSEPVLQATVLDRCGQGHKLRHPRADAQYARETTTSWNFGGVL